MPLLTFLLFCYVLVSITGSYNPCGKESLCNVYLVGIVLGGFTQRNKTKLHYLTLLQGDMNVYLNFLNQMKK